MKAHPKTLRFLEFELGEVENLVLSALGAFALFAEGIIENILLVGVLPVDLGNVAVRFVIVSVDAA